MNAPSDDAAMVMIRSTKSLERLTALVSPSARLKDEVEVPETCEHPSLFSVVEEKEFEGSSEDDMEPFSLMVDDNN